MPLLGATGGGSAKGFGALANLGYFIRNSLRFRSSASARLSRTFATTGTNNKIQTLSVWVKRGLLSGSTTYRLMGCYDGSSANSTEINFSNDTLRIEFGGAASNSLITTQVFRDPSAWYHIVIAIDTTQATAANRVKMYVNGNQVTAFSTATYPAQNAVSQLTSANANNSIGAGWSGFEYFDGYMTEVNFIDGQALTPSSFGSTSTTTGSWIPKKYTGTYGTNGFYLNFSDIATTSGSNAGLGKDFSGNANYWTTNNISVTAGVTYDAMLDVCTNTSATVGNYCVMNPLVRLYGTATLSDANLKINDTSTGGGAGYATIAVTSGKFYYEFTPSAVGKTSGMGVTFASTYSFGYDGCYVNNGAVSNTTGGSAATYASYTTNDVIGVAFDADAGKVWFYKNGTIQAGDPVAGTGSAFTWAANSLVTATFAMDNTAGTVGINTNFGQRPFSYTPPTGFVRLNTFNLPDSTIKKGNTVMDATLYTGNGSTQTITNAGGFYPDLIWVKSRSNATNHNLFTSVLSGANILKSNSTDGVVGVTNAVTAFNSNGFTLGSDSGSIGVNINSNTYVAWQWLAGATTGTTTNTNGSITSFINVNTTAGFSQVYWTGTAANGTLGHGLGVAPKMIITKCRGASTDWAVGHTSIANTQYLVLNSTAAVATGATYWNSTSPTSSVFSVGSSNPTNAATAMVAYCWAEIAGFSKFGSYTGNGVNGNGPFVYCGFRPKFVMFKNTNTTQNWIVMDTARDTKNKMTQWLSPNTSGAEYTDANIDVDFVSNGFKIRTSIGTELNGNGNSIIFAAYAENPFKNANAR